MRKPSAFQFFFLEALVWIFILAMVAVYHEWGSRVALPVFFLKASVVNICVATFNMIGFCMMTATGFCPWQGDTGSMT